MFYTYAEKEGEGFFGGWYVRQVAFDTMRRYLYYSEPLSGDLSRWDTAEGRPATVRDGTHAGTTEPASTHSTGLSPLTAHDAVSEVAIPPTSVQWRRKVKVTAMLPLAAAKELNPRRCTSERDLYRLEVQGESRPLVRGETPPAGPLLCPAAGLSPLERLRCRADNDEYVQDPLFLKELFDGLRDQFEEIERERVRAAASAPAAEDSTALNRAKALGVGSVQTLLSPRGPHGEHLFSEAVTSVRLVLRCRDEREFRRLWYVLQSVLGYDRLLVRPYRGLPPYDPRNGVAFAHIPMSVWHTFQALDKAVFYTFTYGDVYAFVEPRDGERTIPSASPGRSTTVASSSSSPRTPHLTRVYTGVYLCITHDSVLCMRDSGLIPRWLRLAEMHEFHWNLVARNSPADPPAPFCVFISEAPVPDLLFEPKPPPYSAEVRVADSALVDVRRIVRVIHDTCFASLGTRRVILMKEANDASKTAYATRRVGTGGHYPVLQQGDGYNSTLSCPLPKEQLAVVWQQVQAELLSRGNMTNRAAIPIYASNAKDVALSEDQLSTVERELDGRRERRDDIVGMPLEQARLLERCRWGSSARGGQPSPSPPRPHRHPGRNSTPLPEGPPAASSRPSTGSPHRGAALLPSRVPIAASIMPPTVALLRTPQLQGKFARGSRAPRVEGRASLHAEGVGASSLSKSSCSDSIARTSEYTHYVVPGARYFSLEEWQEGGYAAAAASTEVTAAGVPQATPQQEGQLNPPPAPLLEEPFSDGKRMERSVEEIMGQSMAALEGACAGGSLTLKGTGGAEAKGGGE